MRLDGERHRECPGGPGVWRAAGFVTSGHGVGAGNDGPVEIMVMAILGAFLGLLVGLMAGNMSRFFSAFANRQIGGIAWGAYGAAAGALLFAILALTGGNQ